MERELGITHHSFTHTRARARTHTYTPSLPINPPTHPPIDPSQVLSDPKEWRNRLVNTRSHMAKVAALTPETHATVSLALALALAPTLTPTLTLILTRTLPRSSGWPRTWRGPSQRWPRRRRSWARSCRRSCSSTRRDRRRRCSNPHPSHHPDPKHNPPVPLAPAAGL